VAGRLHIRGAEPKRSDRLPATDEARPGRPFRAKARILEPMLLVFAFHLWAAATKPRVEVLTAVFVGFVVGPTVALGVRRLRTGWFARHDPTTTVRRSAITYFCVNLGFALVELGTSARAQPRLGAAVMVLGLALAAVGGLAFWT
jgi:hypothetical protein